MADSEYEELGTERAADEPESGDPESGEPGGGEPASAEPSEPAEVSEVRVPAQREESAEHRGRRGRRSVRAGVAAVVGVVGELMITLGVLLALFLVYSLWWTNVLADRDAQRAGDKVRESWRHDRTPGHLDTEDGIGFLHVPSMSHGEVLVKKGTDRRELNEGVAGYYTKPVKSAQPQDRSGNFALAAHRDGHGAKFHDIDRIEKGDPIVFETKNTWFVYKVFRTLPSTSKYNVGVLRDVPKGSGKKHSGRYVTLTTCTPVFTSTYRYVVWGELERTESVDSERTPPRELR